MQKRADKIVDQARLGCVVEELITCFSVNSAAFGANPECGVTVAKHVADSYALDSGKFIRSGLAVLESEEVGRCDPYSFGVFIYGFGIRVGGVWQQNSSDRSGAEAQHARLGSDPDIFFEVFENVQDGIAGNFFGRSHC